MASSLRGGFVSSYGLTPHGLKESVYDFSARLLNGHEVQLKDFREKVLLIVNTASKCGFTPQYAGLEELYRTLHERGFEILAFPCNQFGGQEPGAAGEIGAFCRENYDVSFPMFEKIEVNGANAHPLYRYLKVCRPGLLGLIGASGIKWNFTKFLVDRKGNVAGRYGPSTAPRALRPTIEKLLDSQG